MDLSLQGEQFKAELLQYINNSQLPPVVLYYIMKDLMILVENGYKAYLDNADKKAQEEMEKQQEQNMKMMNNFSSINDTFDQEDVVNNSENIEE